MFIDNILGNSATFFVLCVLSCIVNRLCMISAHTLLFQVLWEWLLLLLWQQERNGNGLMCLSLIHLSGRGSKHVCSGEGVFIHIVVISQIFHGVDDTIRTYISRITKDTKLDPLMTKLDFKVLLRN